MKYFIVVFAVALLLVFPSCKNSDSEEVNTDSVENVIDVNNDNLKADSAQTDNNVELGKEFTAKYICANHCKDSGSDEPGVCPVCGMDYIENPDYQ